MKKKYERLIPMATFVKNQIELVDNNQITKEEFFNNIRKYSKFLSQDFNIYMVIGENAIFKDFLPLPALFDNTCRRAIKGNKTFDFWLKTDGSYKCSEYPTIECLIKYNIDVIKGFF